jgi:hypothetical protein
MRSEPKFPWRIDTNDRYRELVSVILGLSTAALLLPVFLSREFLGVEAEKPLKEIFSCIAYWAWAFLAVSIFACICFYFFSAKWARLAWEQPVSLFFIPISESFVEHALEIFLWLSIIGFLGGIAFTFFFMVGYVPNP